MVRSDEMQNFFISKIFFRLLNYLKHINEIEVFFCINDLKVPNILFII